MAARIMEVPARRELRTMISNNPAAVRKLLLSLGSGWVRGGQRMLQRVGNAMTTQMSVDAFRGARLFRFEFNDDGHIACTELHDYIWPMSHLLSTLGPTRAISFMQGFKETYSDPRYYAETGFGLALSELGEKYPIRAANILNAIPDLNSFLAKTVTFPSKPEGDKTSPIYDHYHYDNSSYGADDRLRSLYGNLHRLSDPSALA
jgi:hypothetical protein